MFRPYYMRDRLISVSHEYMPSLYAVLELCMGVFVCHLLCNSCIVTFVLCLMSVIFCIFINVQNIDKIIKKS